jgi:hypothetical protein
LLRTGIIIDYSSVTSFYRYVPDEDEMLTTDKPLNKKKLFVPFPGITFVQRIHEQADNCDGYNAEYDPYAGHRCTFPAFRIFIHVNTNIIHDFMEKGKFPEK